MVDTAMTLAGSDFALELPLSSSETAPMGLHQRSNCSTASKVR